VRYEIIDITFNKIDNNVIVIIAPIIYYGYNTSSDAYGWKYFIFNIFDKIGGKFVYSIIPDHKDNRYVYRKGAEVTNDNAKKIYLAGQFSDAYVDDFND
jgi:hypothetical protein